MWRRENCKDEPAQNSTVRVSYDSGPGASVFGWPAKGGMYVLQEVSAVEVEWLGLDRLTPVARPDTADARAAADEDELCNKMRQLGAVWWERHQDWMENRNEESRDCLRNPLKDPFFTTGWPAGGGIWVLSTTQEDAAAKNAGVLWNAYTMEERCTVIERLGGTFYADPKQCPHLDLA